MYASSTRFHQPAFKHVAGAFCGFETAVAAFGNVVEVCGSESNSCWKRCRSVLRLQKQQLQRLGALHRHDIGTL